jgi:hypothetical protein
VPTTLSRSLLVALIPGLIAVAPWLLALVQYTDATLGLDDHPVLGHALLFACVAVVGSIFEDLGTYVEHHWDQKREVAYAIRENWFAYLSHKCEKEPVGFRYLSRLATTLYFELSMAFAAPIFFAGSSVLAAQRFPEFACPIALGGSAVVVCSIVFFLWQGSETHKLLCTTRRELNLRLAA